MTTESVSFPAMSTSGDRAKSVAVGSGSPSGVRSLGASTIAAKRASVRSVATALGSDVVRDRLRARGLRWTPQRRVLIEVLAATRGHVTGSELIERCRELDPATIPSTVYRTLDVLEELGLVRHGHGADGREEFHVLPGAEHGHLHCQACGGTWEIGADDAEAIVGSLERARGFHVDLSHVTIVGQCADCARAAAAGSD
jgi:Fur family ferric uptake transcriptional regulator